MEEDTVKWIPVKSSNIQEVAWELGTGEIRGFLFVRFIKSGTYTYLDVPGELYEEMLKAPSIGKFFAEMIKNEFDYVKDEK